MKTPTITIALSAYNEQQNIVRFLKSVLKQQEEGFKIKSVWVYSDGSSDKTVEKAKSIKSSLIKVYEDKKRIGKSARLNQIYKNLKTDILVQSDADVVFAHKYVIRDLIKPLISENKVGMCGGHPIPARGKTFTEKSINLTFEVYAKLRSEVRGGNNKFSVDGRLLAYKKELVKKISVPTDMIANDFYTYMCCLKYKYQYRYVKTAVVTFRSPINLRDHLRQNVRFESAALRMKKHFSPKIVDRETYIPRSILVKNITMQFLKNPFMASYIFLINQYCRLRALKRESKLSAVWDMAESTKKVIYSGLIFVTNLYEK